MSEIKGQLLGIVLVLAIFGAISGALYAAFKTSADNVSTKVSADTKVPPANSANYNAFEIKEFKA